MRRAHAIALSLLLIIVPARHGFAQQIGAGLRGGVSVTDFESDLGDFGTRVGIAFGLFADIGFGSWFAITPELQFVGKGSDNEISAQPAVVARTSLESTSVDVSLNYLELLIPAALTIPLRGPVQPRFYVGPTLALELSCRVAYRAGDVVRQSGCAEQSPDGGTGFVMTTTFDFGVVFGGGVDITAGPGAVAADIRYTQGLTNINAEGEPSLKNRTVEFLIGYTVTLSE